MRGAGEVMALLQGVNREDAVADPRAPYDLATLLLAGIHGWSYEAEVNAENVAALDEPTALWIADQLLAVGRTEDERKNASRTSTKR